MVPIHDTDIASERWSQAEWEHYELWEKIEQRLRRKKWLWIAGTVVVFLMLSAVPIVADRWPQWSSVAVNRELARQINAIKREASIEHLAHRLRFVEGSLSYVVEKGKTCRPPTEPMPFSRAGELKPPFGSGALTVLDPSEADRLGVPGLVRSVCYDPLQGLVSGQELSAFAVMPVKDLAAKRLDRISILVLSGASAELSFE